MKKRQMLFIVSLGLLTSSCGIQPQFRGANLQQQHPFSRLTKPLPIINTSSTRKQQTAEQEKIAVVFSENTLAHLEAIQKLGKEGLQRLSIIGQRESRGYPCYALIKQENFVTALVQPLRKNFTITGVSDDFLEAFSSGAEQAVLLDLSLSQDDKESEKNTYKLDYFLIDKSYHAKRLASIHSIGRWSSAGTVWNICNELIAMRLALATSAQNLPTIK